MSAVDAIFARIGSRAAGTAALVTGSGDAEESGGIGAGIARVLAAAGASVVVMDRDPDAARRTIDQIEAHGGTATTHIGDVTSAIDCDAAIAAAVASFGRLDTLVNNVATLGDATTLDFVDDNFLHTLDVNLMSAVRTARAAQAHLRGGGSIVNVTSLGAVRTWGRLDYEASKGALMSVTRTLAVQLGPLGIRVNDVCPGQAWTPLGRRRLVEMGMDDEAVASARRQRALGCPLQREGTAWDIGLAVLFLAGPDAAWITGQSLVVDGGQSALPGWMPGSTPTG